MLSYLPGESATVLLILLSEVDDTFLVSLIVGVGNEQLQNIHPLLMLIPAAIRPELLISVSFGDHLPYYAVLVTVEERHSIVVRHRRVHPIAAFEYNGVDDSGIGLFQLYIFLNSSHRYL